jgi:hypothetical protein
LIAIGAVSCARRVRGNRVKNGTRCAAFPGEMRRCYEGDPPYTVKHNANGFVKYNESIFSWNDQVRLAKAVEAKARSGASILVTNAYHPTVVDLYKDFASVLPIERSSILSGDKAYRGKTQEALILVGSAWRDVEVEAEASVKTSRMHVRQPIR